MTTIETKPTSDPAVQPALTAIHHNGVTVTDVEASAAWYERVVGFHRQFKERHYRSAAGGYTILLSPPDSSISLGVDHHPANSGDNFDPNGARPPVPSKLRRWMPCMHGWRI